MVPGMTPDTEPIFPDEVEHLPTAFYAEDDDASPSSPPFENSAPSTEASSTRAERGCLMKCFCCLLSALGSLLLVLALVPVLSMFLVPITPVDWTIADADLGDAESCFKVGSLYQHGLGGMQVDPYRAVEWYRKAAEKEHVEAQFRLGLMYGVGIGLPQDFSVAAAWVRRAAEAGFPRAQVRLGAMYHYGYTVPKDEKQALEWYKKNATGNADAHFGIAEIHNQWQKNAKEKGLLNPTERNSDTDAALYEYTKATSLGHEKARLHLGKLYMELEDAKAAIAKFEEAVNSKDEDLIERAQKALAEAKAKMPQKTEL